MIFREILYLRKSIYTCVWGSYDLQQEFEQIQKTFWLMFADILTYSNVTD